MKANTKLRIYRGLTVTNQLVFTALILIILALVAYVLVRANENVATYTALTVGQPSKAQTDIKSRDVVTVNAGGEIKYTVKWTKHVGSPGDIYQSWLRMKYQNGKWVRDTSFRPILASASFRVGRDKGSYTSTSTLVAPDKAGHYVLEIRAEYGRISGAEPSIDVKQSNVLYVRPVDTLDLQGQVDALTGQLEQIRSQYGLNNTSFETAPVQERIVASPRPAPSVTPTPSQTPAPSPSPLPSPVPAATPRPCLLGLLRLCILGAR